MATINSPAIAIELQALQPRSFPIDAPVTAFALAAFPPSVYEVPTGVFNVCTLNPTPPSSGDTTGPFLPLPEGFDPDDLPLLDSGDIVDTSPNQIIGCVDILVEDYEQNILNALFPGAVAGDGVVARETEDIWKYDGTIWENVGPSPGPTILPRPVVPLIQYIERYDASIHTRLQIQSLDYALALLTEPDPIGVVLGLDVDSIRLVRVPAASYEIQALAPAYNNPYTAINSVVPLLYLGTGSAQSIAGLPWQPGMVWVKGRDNSQPHVLQDSLRGTTVSIYPNLINSEVFSGTNFLTSFDPTGFSLGTGNAVNQFGASYVSWSFAPVAAAVTNTQGTISSSVRATDFYSIFTYTGNATAGATVGHGLESAPELVIIKSLSINNAAAAGGPSIGDDSTALLNSVSAVSSTTSYIRSTNSSTVVLGDNTAVNSTDPRRYVGYAFRNVQGVCKSAIYTGDGDTGGLFIDCGFKVRFLIVKRRTGGSGAWNLIDSARDAGNNQLLLNSTNEVATTADFYELQGNGFVAKRGDLNTNHDLNISGSTYMYIAFGGYTPTVITDLAELELTALPPSV
jgi:hypothetical protein